MEQFCREVIKFLEMEYSGGYDFKLERTISLDYHNCNKLNVELRIKVSSHYIKILNHASIDYIFNLYREGEFIEEREQFKWQKELIDLIEGS